jgi:hypothetical protein
MITDVFVNRYPQKSFCIAEVPGDAIKAFRQAGDIVFRDLEPFLDDPERLYERVHTILARELGAGIRRGSTYREILAGCLFEVQDTCNDLHGTADYFVKVRLSLIELLFREIERQFASGRRSTDMAVFSYLKKRLSPTNDENDESAEKKAFRDATQELNRRLARAGIPFHYHNGMLQRADDGVTTAQILEPFWNIVSDSKWENVDIDMKEAIDRRDSGGRDAALYALKALESTIKIISDDKGWSIGTERGAGNYIDNLVNSSNGPFIDVWESYLLKELFRHVRNPHGHGAGAQPQPSLTPEQTNWTIETSMSWIKSLVHRL